MLLVTQDWPFTPSTSSPDEGDAIDNKARLASNRASTEILAENACVLTKREEVSMTPPK